MDKIDAAALDYSGTCISPRIFAVDIIVDHPMVNALYSQDVQSEAAERDCLTRRKLP